MIDLVRLLAMFIGLFGGSHSTLPSITSVPAVRAVPSRTASPPRRPPFVRSVAATSASVRVTPTIPVAPVAPAASTRAAAAPLPRRADVPATVPLRVAPAPVKRATAPTLASECSVAVAYLEAHAAPGFAFHCLPGSLGVGVQATTCWAGCPGGVPEVTISDPACAIAYENEASNTYLEWRTLTAGVTGTTGVDARGRHVDPYGQCPA